MILSELSPDFIEYVQTTSLGNLALDLHKMGLPMDITDIVGTLQEIRQWGVESQPKPKPPEWRKPWTTLTYETGNYPWKVTHIFGQDYPWPDAETYLDPLNMRYSCTYDTENRIRQEKYRYMTRLTLRRSK